MAATETQSPPGGGQGGGLRRTVGPTMFALYGAGTILGAGIYVLIGEVAAEAGYWAPLAFLLAAFIAGVNGMVYAELATRMPRAGGPSAYLSRAFGRPWLSISIGWAIVVTGVVSSATIASGFSGYLAAFIDVPEWAARAGLIVALATLAAAGVSMSAKFMAVTTTCGVAGLGLVLWAGFGTADGDATRVLDQAADLGDATVLTGVLSATFLAIYAFIGFEDMVHMAEEVKRPNFSMPVGIGAALALCAVLYTVTAIAALAVLSPEQLDGAAPLVDVVEATSIPAWPVTLLSLIIIPSGVLAQLIMASRVIYSLGHRDDAPGAPGWLARVNDRTGTPVVATAASAAVALVLALFIPLATLASITSLVMLVVFAASNVALIVLERRQADAPFDLPRVLPWIGAVLSVGMIVTWATLGGSGH